MFSSRNYEPNAKSRYEYYATFPGRIYETYLNAIIQLKTFQTVHVLSDMGVAIQVKEGMPQLCHQRYWKKDRNLVL